MPWYFASFTSTVQTCMQIISFLIWRRSLFHAASAFSKWENYSKTFNPWERCSFLFQVLLHLLVSDWDDRCEIDFRQTHPPSWPAVMWEKLDADRCKQSQFLPSQISLHFVLFVFRIFLIERRIPRISRELLFEFQFTARTCMSV